MAKVRVLAEFRDVNNYAIVYRIGNTYEFSDKMRVENIVKLGLGEIVEEERAETPKAEVEKPMAEKPAQTSTMKKKTTKKNRK